MMRAIGLALSLSIGASAQVAPDRWVAAEKAIRHLTPAAFQQLPPKIGAYLKQRGCTVPQSYFGEGRHNVVRGAFLGPRQQDWAALCSHNGESVILVFRTGRSKPVAELAAAEDSGFLQTVTGDGRIGYSRSISPVSRRQIVSYQEAFGSPLPPAIDHQGINDSFDGKASVIHYFYRDRWLELQGMD